MSPQARDPLEWRLITQPRVLLFVSAVALAAGWELERRNLMAFGGSLLAWIVAARLTLPDFSRLRCRREHGERAFEGETVRVTLELDPAGAVGFCQHVEVCDEFPAGDGYYVRALLDTAFARGRAARLHYRPRCSRPRGLYVLGPVEIGGTDPSGLFESKALLDLFTHLLVYPRAALLERFDPMDTRAIRHLGERVDPLAGFSQEFREIREYRPGDSPRRVHWPASARHGKLMVKAFEDAVTAEVALFLDLGRFARAGLGEVNSEEAAVSAAAALATLAAERGELVSLQVVAEREISVPFGSGGDHLYALLNALALARGGGRRDFAQAIEPAALALRRGSTAAFVLTATAASEPDIEALVRGLQLRGVRAAAALIDDRSYHALSMEQQTAQLRRRPVEEIAADWTVAGVEVFVIAKGTDLRRELEHASFRSAMAPRAGE